NGEYTVAIEQPFPCIGCECLPGAESVASAADIAHALLVCAKLCIGREIIDLPTAQRQPVAFQTRYHPAASSVPWLSAIASWWRITSRMTKLRNFSAKSGSRFAS